MLVVRSYMAGKCLKSARLYIDVECGLCFWICTCTHITTKKQGCSFTTTNEMSEMGDVVHTELGADDASVLKGKSR